VFYNKFRKAILIEKEDRLQANIEKTEIQKEKERAL